MDLASFELPDDVRLRSKPYQEGFAAGMAGDVLGRSIKYESGTPECDAFWLGWEHGIREKQLETQS